MFICFSVDFFFFFWLHCVAGRILVLQQRVIPMPPAMEAWSLNHWTTREVPICPLRPARHCTQWWKYTKGKRDKVPALRDLRIWKNDPKIVQALRTFWGSFKHLKTILMFIPNFPFLSIFFNNLAWQFWLSTSRHTLKVIHRIKGYNLKEIQSFGKHKTQWILMKEQGCWKDKKELMGRSWVSQKVHNGFFVRSYRKT